MLMKNGIYVYGVIKTDGPQDFGEIGIGDKASKVFTINFKDLAVVVSKSPFIIYDSLAKERTIKDLVTHQFAIEKVMESFTVMPVKFGTMVETEDEAIKFLEKGYFILGNVLRKMEGIIELDVVASWKLPKILAVIYSSHRRVQKKQQEIASCGDKASVEDKVVLGKLIEQALSTKKTKDSRLILQTLKKGAIETCLHDLTGDEMVFNAAFLIKAANKEKFNKILDKLDQRFEDTLNFRLVGPLPPYSFSTILFKRISQQEVENAKKTLGLNGEITDKTVNGAYRQLAQKYHPDKQSLPFADAKRKQSLRPAKAGLKHAGQGQLKFDLINSAYRVLKDFTKRGFFDVDIYHWEGQR